MLPQLAIANKLAALAGASLIGTATAAAAISGGFSTDVPEAETVEVIEEIEIVQEFELEIKDETDDDSKVGELDEEESDEVLPPFNEDANRFYGDVLCEDAENHGEYVSGVAKDELPDGVRRGEIVSQAAKTECGKKDKSDDDSDEDDSEQKKDKDDSDDSDDSDDTDDTDDDDSDDDDSDDDDSDDDDSDSKNKGNGNGKKDEPKDKSRGGK